jgi:mannose/fructose-specific phosphotransferase system component IIA
MRKPLILIALPLVFSCSVIKHKEESHKESSTETTQASSSSTASVDTSKTSIDEYWRITVPMKLKAQPTENNFPGFSLPDLAGATKEQRDASLEMQKQYNAWLSAANAQGKSNDAAGQNLSILIEMFKKTQEQAGKSTNEQKQDTLSHKHSESENHTEKDKKEQLNVWQVIALVGILAFVVVKIFK